MNPLIEEDTIFRKYLLGELSPAERGEVEERLFLDTEFFQHLQMAEDELIDDYVYGELSANERAKFNDYFLSTTEHHESLKIAQALKKYTPKNTAPVASASPDEIDSEHPLKPGFLPFLNIQNPALRFSLAACILLVALGGLWLVIRAIRKPDRPAPVQVQVPGQSGEEQKARPDAGQQTPPQLVDEKHQPALPGADVKETVKSGEQRVDVRQPPSPTGQTKVYSFLLLPIGMTRGGGEANKIDLPADTDALNLQLPLVDETAYDSYRATLSTPDGRQIRSWARLEPARSESEKIISIRIPAELLRDQNYQVKLEGMTAVGAVHGIGNYSFQVSKKR